MYRTRERIAERGGKPGFYVVVSRAFVAENDDVATVICAPVYSQVLGLTTEVVLGPDDGLPRTSAVRFLDAHVQEPADGLRRDAVSAEDTRPGSRARRRAGSAAGDKPPSMTSKTLDA